MKEKKTRIFWDPFEVSDYVSRERWLEDLAAKGWKLVRYTGRFPKFEKITPFKARYRLDYHHDKNMDEEQIALYEAEGWQYVDTLGEQFYIFMTTDPRAEELHTDPEMQAYSLKKLMKNHVANMILAILFSGFYIWRFYAILIKHHLPLTVLLHAGPWIVVLFILLIAFSLSIHFSQGIRFVQIWRQLRDPDVTPTPKNYRKSVWKNVTGSVFAVVFLFSIIFAGFLFVPKETKFEIPDYPEPLPFLQLHEIEPSDDFRYAFSKIDDTNWANQLETTSTLFAPQIMKARQYRASTTTASDRVSYLYTEYLTVTHEKLATRVLYELRANAEYSFSYKWTTLSVSGADEAYYYADGTRIADDVEDLVYSAGDLMFQDDGYQFLFLRVGNQVIKICYHGTQNLAEFADEYVALLTP